MRVRAPAAGRAGGLGRIEVESSKFEQATGDEARAADDKLTDQLVGAYN